MLVEGSWRQDWKPTDGREDGRFVRKPTTIRGVLEDMRPGRYHLYVALTCPWAHRVLLARRLKGLDDVVTVHVLEPELTERGWAFGPDGDPLSGASHLWELYVRHDPGFTGRVTVPLLWDSARGCAVNNESSELLRMLDALPSAAPSLVPEAHRAEIEALSTLMYDGLNNGVYRAGFARSQSAYEAAVTEVFATLDAVEAHLGDQPWLVGTRPTEADIRLFVTAIRFHVAYYGLFKCNLRPLSAYPAIAAHTRRFYALDGVADTMSFDHIVRGYASIRAINPTGIVPAGPEDPLP